MLNTFPKKDIVITIKGAQGAGKTILGHAIKGMLTEAGCNMKKIKITETQTTEKTNATS